MHVLRYGFMQLQRLGHAFSRFAAIRSYSLRSCKWFKPHERTQVRRTMNRQSGAQQRALRRDLATFTHRLADAAS
jgi:hypothetical protein